MTCHSGERSDEESGVGRSPHPQIPLLPRKDRNDICQFHLDAVLHQSQGETRRGWHAGFSYITGRWRVLPSPEMSIVRRSHAEPAAAAKHLGWGVNPSRPQTLHFVQGDNRKILGWCGCPCRSHLGFSLIIKQAKRQQPRKRMSSL